MHTSLDGSYGHDPYGPCGLGDLQRAGFRYWALGHIHKRLTVEGDTTVVMPGMPQGRDINEAGAKSVTLATVTDDKSIVLEERFTSVAQFERVAVDLAGIEDWKDVVAAMEEALGQAREKVESEHLVARLHVTGATPLGWRLRRDLDLLRTEAQDRASSIGKCWIDKVVVDCRSPQPVRDAADHAAGDPLEELRRLMSEEVMPSESYLAEISAIAEELRSQLPAECRGILGADEDAFAATLSEAARDGIEDVLARLRAGSDAEAG
jgi:DNA repair exonuclease SbcCD nuclease subunit